MNCPVEQEVSLFEILVLAPKKTSSKRNWYSNLLMVAKLGPVLVCLCQQFPYFFSF